MARSFSNSLFCLLAIFLACVSRVQLIVLRQELLRLAVVFKDVLFTSFSVTCFKAHNSRTSNL